MEEQQTMVSAPIKKRSQADKVGRIKYQAEKLRDLELEMRVVKRMVLAIYHGLMKSHLLEFDKDFLTSITSQDKIDLEILHILRAAGREGILPKDLSIELSVSGFKVRRFQVSRRIIRINKRLQKELSQNAAEKQGHKWALTKFMVESWGEGIVRAETKEELEVAESESKV
jgi:hypothetical protein